VGYNAVVDNTGLSLIRLTVVVSQICDILRNSRNIRTHSSSRSSKVIDLGVSRKSIAYATS